MVRLDPPVEGGNDLPLWIGGPVEPERGWILLGEEPAADFKRIRDGLYLSTSQALLREVLEAKPAPRARVIAGYAGWGPGQLDEELAHSSWLLSDVDLDLVFDTPADGDVGGGDPPDGRRPSMLTTSLRRALAHRGCRTLDYFARISAKKSSARGSFDCPSQNIACLRTAGF